MQRGRDEVPASLRIRALADLAAGEGGHEAMQRLTLELTFLKSRCVLYRAFLTHGRGEPRYDGHRGACRAAALGVLALHLEYERETAPGGVLDRRGRPFVLGSMTAHDFLLAGTILCLDLSEGGGLR